MTMMITRGRKVINPLVELCAINVVIVAVVIMDAPAIFPQPPPGNCLAHKRAKTENRNLRLGDKETVPAGLLAGWKSFEPNRRHATPSRYAVPLLRLARFQLRLKP